MMMEPEVEADVVSKQSPRDLSILIVSYNTRELTLECIESVIAETKDAPFSYEILVLDNDSNDGSADAIQREFGDEPLVKLVRLDHNIGFADGNNRIAKNATGKRLLLLNPDTKILDRGIVKLMECADRHPDAILGGRTYFGDGSFNPTSCHGWPTLWSVTCMGLGLSTMFRNNRVLDPESLGPWKRDTVREVPVVTGCFLLIRWDQWLSLGGFDTTFFMYGEETDLCRRAARRGIPRMICPDAKLIHYGGASEKVRSDRMVKLFNAKVRFFRKHWSKPACMYGVAMLKLWAWSRMAGHWGIRQLGKQTAGYDAWRDIWRRRREFAAEHC